MSALAAMRAKFGSAVGDDAPTKISTDQKRVGTLRLRRAFCMLVVFAGLRLRRFCARCCS